MKDPGFRSGELSRWASAFPGAEILALPDVGHYVPEEAPERLGAAVERVLST
jgi:pimeloyl-ACP methyl ester carboxylesterase